MLINDEIIPEATESDVNSTSVTLLQTASGTKKLKGSTLKSAVLNEWSDFVNALTPKTSFASGDVIPVDGPSGTAKMSKDDLLARTAENAHGTIKDITNDKHLIDINATDVLASDGAASGSRKLPLNEMKAMFFGNMDKAIGSLEKIGMSRRLSFVLNDGYVDNSGVMGSYTSGGKYKRTDKLDVEGVEFIFYHGETYYNVTGCFYSADGTFMSNIGIVKDAYIHIPSGAKWFVGSSYASDADHSGFYIEAYVRGSYDILLSEHNSLINKTGFDEIEFPLILVDGYVSETGTHGSTYSGGGVYKKSFERIYIEHCDTLRYTGMTLPNATCCFYDKDDVFIRNVGEINNTTIVVPDNAVWFRATSVDYSKQHNNIKLFGSRKGTISKSIIIACTGDSTTEGLYTTGAHTADYGKDPYPARLTTMLVDRGYKDITVLNYGHGGECTPDISARIGGFACVLNDNVTIPAGDNSASLGDVSFTPASSPHAGIHGTKLDTCGFIDRTGSYYGVFFRGSTFYTNPVMIGGYNYEISSHGEPYHNEIKRSGWSSDEATVLPKGSVLFTSNLKHPDINIFSFGINDQNSLTLSNFISAAKRNGAVNGGKYICFGSTANLPAWYWPDVVGDTAQEKWEYAYNKITEELGIHYVDMRKEFHDQGFRILEEDNLLTGYTAEEIETIKSDLSDWHIPAALSYDGNHRDNVHLNRTGYQVMAHILFGRLVVLGYI